MEGKTKAERIIPLITTIVLAILGILGFLWGDGILRHDHAGSEPSNSEISESINSTVHTTDISSGNTALEPEAQRINLSFQNIFSCE